MRRLVVDASAAVDVITSAPGSASLADVIAGAAFLDVPEHFHVEALSAIRGLHRRGQLDGGEARLALGVLPRLRTAIHPVLPLAVGVWALRDVLSTYDAAYLALAARLDADLLTVDRGLAAVARAEGRLVDLE